jgi:para-aminobenzoate synthetase/4-amino-4-deoxychorismate lyase
MPALAYCEIDFPHPSKAGRLTAAFSRPECILTAATADEVPGLLHRAEEHSRAGCWVIGFVAYEAAPAFDRALHAHAAPADGLPFALFAVFRNMDATPRSRGSHLCGAWRDETARGRFDGAIAHIRQGITAGDYYQVNYTTRLRAPFSGDGLSFFDSLRASQPAAYCSYLDFGPWQICSVSPELFFHWGNAEDTGRPLTCRPMKGTAARYEDPALDHEAAQALQRSPKERAENLMIVDLVRNDLSRVARPGSVTAGQLFSVEAWPTVWQMTSTISCRTNDGVNLREVFRALFPCGSVTGAPKAAAMSAIRALEASPRGVYCGAVGALMPGGEALFSVGIRTPVINAKAGSAECGIGSGITLDSDANLEHEEWLAKQVFLMQSCPEYELLETLRLHQGRYWLLRGHMKRLAKSAHALGFDFDEAVITQALQSHARLHHDGNWRVRLMLAPAGKARIETLPLDVPALDTHSGAPLIALASAPIPSTNPWLRHKTTRREIYSGLASQQAGIFDTLLHNERGELTEFTRGNLVVELGGRLLTPPADCGLLPGVYRDVLLARKVIREGIVRIDGLAHANRIWFINSVRGAVAVRLPASFHG